MSNPIRSTSCAWGAVGIAALAAIAFWLLFLFGFSWLVSQSTMIAVILFVFIAAFLIWLLCRPLTNAVSAPVAATSVSSATASAQATAPAAKPSAAPKPAAKAKASPPRDGKTVSDDHKPELLTAARDGGPDNLKMIKGVGPKLEKLLHSMGVYHFDQVASWKAKEVAWVDENLEGFHGRVKRDEWVKQAKTLAKGGTTEFAKKVAKGGVYAKK